MSITTLNLPNLSKDFFLEVAKGNVPGHSIINKFGKNKAITTTPAALTNAGVYQTPTAATTLRIKSGGNANDTAAGSGAREITLVGLDANFVEQTVTLATAGASASAATTATFIRLYSAYVSTSGTYGGVAAISHAGNITIENGTGGTNWAIIPFDVFPRAQAQIGAYTVPAGKTAYLYSQHTFVEANKPVNMMLFQRQNADDVAAPYSAIRLVNETVGAGGQYMLDHRGMITFPEKTDLGYLAYVETTTASASVEFNLLLVDN